MSKPLDVPSGYVPFDPAGLSAWLSGRPALAARLGGGPADWRIEEVGDGNLNLVFLELAAAARAGLVRVPAPGRDRPARGGARRR